MIRQTIAVAGAAAAGVAVALVGSQQLAGTTTTTETVAAPPITCEAITARGTVANACVSETDLYLQSFRNPFRLLPYSALWRKDNPGEWQSLVAFSRSAPTTPAPTVRTHYGGMLRYGLTQCRTWAATLDVCALG